MLEAIVEKKRKTLSQLKKEKPLAELEKGLTQGTFRFRQAFQADWCLIAECKLRSPAKGLLHQKYTVDQLADIYQKNGAGALSIHTDTHFDGKLEDLMRVRRQNNLPILRKDFMLEPYQVVEARAAGADAILLIAAVLPDRELEQMATLAEELGMDALVEVHSREEFNRAEDLGCSLIGINNRDLTTFRTDIRQTFELLEHKKTNAIIVSESGIRTGDDRKRLREAGVKGILVGEALVVAEDIGQLTRELANKA